MRVVKAQDPQPQWTRNNALIGVGHSKKPNTAFNYTTKETLFHIICGMSLKLIFPNGIHI